MKNLRNLVYLFDGKRLVAIYAYQYDNSRKTAPIYANDVLGIDVNHVWLNDFNVPKDLQIGENEYCYKVDDVRKYVTKAKRFDRYVGERYYRECYIFELDAQKLIDYYAPNSVGDFRF